MDLSVVVPVYNEEQNIQSLIAEIRAALDGKLDYEMVYVDDGSNDGTEVRLRECQRQLPRLRVLHHSESCGQSTAVYSGVERHVVP